MEEKIEQIIMKVCDSDFTPSYDTDLVDTGLMDSLAFILLLNELEGINIEIQPTQVDNDRFRTIRSITELVKEFEIKATKVS